MKVTVEPGDVKTMLSLLGFSEKFVNSTTGSTMRLIVIACRAVCLISVCQSASGVFRALLRDALDYDAMVLLCDSCRRMNMEKMRK